jgi:tetratricopeptide (TPR) repeat protein
LTTEVEKRIMKKPFAAITVFILISCQSTPEEHFNRAKDLIKIGEYNLAIKELNDAITKKSDYAAAYLERGKSILSIKDYSYSKGDTNYFANKLLSAADDFTRAIELSNNLKAEALDLRSSIYWMRKEYKKAEADLESLLSIDSSNYRIITILANAKVMLGDSSGVKNLFDAIIKREPENAEAYYGRALGRLVLLNDKKGGCEDLNKAEKLYNPNKKYSTNFLLPQMKELKRINCNQ